MMGHLTTVTAFEMSTWQPPRAGERQNSPGEQRLGVTAAEPLIAIA